MTSKSEIVTIIRDLIDNGINMDKYSIYRCNLFMKELSDFINTDTHLNAHYSGKKITIESIFFDPLLFVELDKTTIQCIPVTDEGWLDAVFEVLKFLHLTEAINREEEAKKLKQKEQDSKDLDWI